MHVQRDGTKCYSIPGTLKMRWLSRAIVYGPMVVGPVAMLGAQVYSNGWDRIVLHGDVLTFLALGFGAGVCLSLVLGSLNLFFEVFEFVRRYPPVRLTPDGVLHVNGRAFSLWDPGCRFVLARTPAEAFEADPAQAA